MHESPIEDNESVHSSHSDESTVSISAQKERLEALFNMELKHSGVYYDLHSKDNFLRVDLENVYNSCQRYANQEKKTCELLEESYETLTNYQQTSRVQLQEKLTSIAQQLEEINASFYEAFQDYNSEVLKHSIYYLDNDTQQLEKKLIENTEKLHTLQSKGKIIESLTKSKPSQITNIDSATNMLFEFSMKRPEIKLEETGSKLTREIKELEQKRQELRSVLRKH